jgi:hypothetical protein
MVTGSASSDSCMCAETASTLTFCMRNALQEAMATGTGVAATW